MYKIFYHEQKVRSCRSVVVAKAELLSIVARDYFDEALILEACHRIRNITGKTKTDIGPHLYVTFEDA